MDKRDRAFAHGISVAGAAGGILLAFVFIVAAPTEDYRARIAFLLDSGGLRPVAFVMGAFELAALVALIATSWRLTTRWAALGATAGSAILTGAFYSGLFQKILPEFGESPARWIVFVVCVTVSGGLLVHYRATMRRDG